MTEFDENLTAIAALIPDAKRRAVTLGGRHPFWQIILDAEALVEDRRTFHKGTREELARLFRSWLEENFPPAD